MRCHYEERGDAAIPVTVLACRRLPRRYCSSQSQAGTHSSERETAQGAGRRKPPAAITRFRDNSYRW